MYNKKVLKHFKNPHNFGKIPNANGEGRVGNIVCGDYMSLYLKINKNKKGEEIIKDIKFETFGCVAAIATSSIITDIAKGKTVTEAIKLNKDNIVDTLEELPLVKIHCSVLAIDALQEAIYDYLSKNKKTIPKELQKRHRRIQNEKKMIEKKYADWIE
jgi:nitrogen fixation protein NifU and related proteins